MVDKDTALLVACQEKRAFEGRLAGRCGPESAEDARKRGLVGVAEWKCETTSGRTRGWEVLDLCTNERYFRPAPKEQDRKPAKRRA
jgi:hypothetical protein